MKIELSSDLVFCIADQCAETIHGQMVQMNLRRSWGIREDGSAPNPYEQHPYQREGIQSIRAAVRSIECPYERRSFCATLKFLLNKICAEKGTERKWQDYVASVEKAKADHDANQPTARRESNPISFLQPENAADTASVKLASTKGGHAMGCFTQGAA